MTAVEISEPFAYGGHLYVKAPRALHFRSDVPLEEAVPETKRHLENRTMLYLLLKDALPGASFGSDQFVYSDPEDPRKCISPDVFVKLGTADTAFDNWKVWERGALDVAVEIVSDHDRSEKKWEEKLAHYRSNGVREIVRFDAENKAHPIRVWDRVEGDLVERSREDPKLHECAALALWWVIAPSAHGPMLRLARDREGRELLPTPEEVRLRLADELAEARRARSAAEHERMLAERERDAAMAELARLRAEVAGPK